MCASVHRPERELKAFAKVKLPPGGRKAVRLSLTRRSLAFFDTRASSWRLEVRVPPCARAHATHSARQ